MLYEKDIYGNVIGTGGDDTSLQNEKMAGYPGYNMFDKQRDAAVLTQGEIEGKTGVSLGGTAAGNGTAVTTSSPTSGAALSKYINGEQLTPADYMSLDKLSGGGRPKVLGADKNDEDILRARAGLPPLETAGGAEDTNIPRYTPITSTEQLAAAMGYTSPQEEERLRKASVTNQRILAIGDALRHIGNIANTVRYAPSQQFNSPVTDEIARYERGKALRDKANATLLTYQQQKAAQERAERKLEAQIKKQEADAARNDRIADARISRYNAQNSKDKASQAYWETRARLQEEGWPLEKAIKEARKAQIDAQTELTKVKTANGGSVQRSSTRRGGKVKAGSGGGKYWIDVPGEGRIYYPNQPMWRQGIESHSDGSDRYETVQTGKDALGRPQTKQTKTSWEQRAVNIQRGKTNVNKGKTPSKGSQGSKGGSGKTQGKTTAKGKGGYGNGTRSALNKIIGGK